MFRISTFTTAGIIVPDDVFWDYIVKKKVLLIRAVFSCTQNKGNKKMLLLNIGTLTRYYVTWFEKLL